MKGSEYNPGIHNPLDDSEGYVFRLPVKGNVEKIYAVEIIMPEDPRHKDIIGERSDSYLKFLGAPAGLEGRDYDRELTMTLFAGPINADGETKNALTFRIVRNLPDSSPIDALNDFHTSTGESIYDAIRNMYAQRGEQILIDQRQLREITRFAAPEGYRNNLDAAFALILSLYTAVRLEKMRGATVFTAVMQKGLSKQMETFLNGDNEEIFTRVTDSCGEKVKENRNDPEFQKWFLAYPYYFGNSSDLDELILQAINKYPEEFEDLSLEEIKKLSVIEKTKMLTEKVFVERQDGKMAEFRKLALDQAFVRDSAELFAGSVKDMERKLQKILKELFDIEAPFLRVERNAA